LFKAKSLPKNTAFYLKPKAFVFIATGSILWAIKTFPPAILLCLIEQKILYDISTTW
jgi:hypothetical protein